MQKRILTEYKLLKIMKMNVFNRCCLILVILMGLISCNKNTDLNCSTFMLKNGKTIFVGHNLDEDPKLHVPGMVCINKRGISREGITWYELISDPPDFEKVLIPYEEKKEPKIKWTSKYGSVTFNSEGLDFPDGGINERGLSIFEMSMGETKFTTDSTKPTLFITLWIQFQLDNYSSVDEVLTNISDINQQGWSWHYFISDRSGDYAIVEYINGEIYIYKDNNAPHPILCNLAYEREINGLKDYDGISGRIKSFIFTPPRFVRGVKLLKEFRPEDQSSTKDYAFEILDNIKVNGWNKWGILIDVSEMVIYYHTNKNRELKYFSINQCDFSAGTPTKMLDMYKNDISGNVISYFEDYSYNKNYDHNLERAKHLFKERFYGLIDNGVPPEVYAKRFADYSSRMRTDPLNLN